SLHQPTVDAPMGPEQLPGGHEVELLMEAMADLHHHVRIAVVTVVGGDQHTVVGADPRRQVFDPFQPQIGDAVIKVQIPAAVRLEERLPSPACSRRPEAGHGAIDNRLPHGCTWGIRTMLIEAVTDTRPEPFHVALAEARGVGRRAPALYDSGPAQADS